MASSFPRGGSVTSEAAGAGTASLVLPAIPGITHVIDSVSAKLRNNGAAIAQSYDVNLSSTTIGLFAVCALIVANAAVSDTDSFSGPISGGPGEAVTITFNAAAVAGITELLKVEWHDE